MEIVLVFNARISDLTIFAFGGKTKLLTIAGMIGVPGSSDKV